MIRNYRLLNKPLSMWLVSLILFAVSLEGILSFPGLVRSSQTVSHYLVVTSHALYVIAGIVIILGLWLSLRVTSSIVIIWGFVSLGAAIGGPLAFSQIPSTFPRTAFIMTLAIFVLTCGLFLYTRNFIGKGKAITNT
jgi:hypothetical protein